MTVAPWGTGRKDYSENVEYSVEPVIRGPQTQYNYYLEIPNVAAGGSATVDIDITADTVVILYDFYLTATADVMLDFNIFALSNGVAATIFRDRGFQRIYHPIPQGFPFSKPVIVPTVILTFSLVSCM
ncbi:unnamed protein product, partial [marine sediment metagenome]